jgi:hypothetical protein
MITETLKTWTGETKSLLTNPRALAILAALYAVLLASLYGFISIREATLWQVSLTMLLLVLIPLEFFVLQAAILQHARIQKFHWGQILRDAIKLAVVTIPIILLGFLIQYLLNKWQAHYLAPEPSLILPGAKPPAPLPVHWPSVLFATARLLLLGVVLPLATIQLWIETVARDLRSSFSGGVKPVFQRIGNALARAFQSDSVLTYALGLIVFVLVPYAVLFMRIPIKGNKTEFAVFILRLLLVYLFTLVGWIVTVNTLTKIEPPPTEPVSAIQPAQVEAAA